MGRAPPNEVRSIAMLLLPLLIATHEHPVQVIDMLKSIYAVTEELWVHVGLCGHPFS